MHAILSKLVVMGGLALMLGMPAAQSPAQAPVAPAPSAQAPGRDSFAGVWEYNVDDSVNAATGRPELDPNQRRPGGAGGTGSVGGRGTRPPAGGTGSGSGGGFGTGMGAGGGGGGFGEGRGFDSGGLGSATAAAELRATQRDLFEMARRYTITVTPDAVTFKDDLDRERTYPTSGKKQKYQLGAASYEAKMHWDGPQLIKDIEAAYGFKMTETYFLSSDGTRLFAIVRIVPKKKDDPVVGANRVYDRVK